MATGYDKVPIEVTEMVAEMMHEHHPELEAAGVTVQTLFAFKYDDETGAPEPAMKTRGQTVLAKISITNLQDRVRGIADAKLVIDRAFGWERISNGRRQALIDHELTHLNLTTDADGMTKLDDCRRPKLHMRHHDWELTGFAEVCERHGEAAVEVHEILRWQEEYGQYAMFPLKGTTEVRDALEKVLRPGNGIDRVTISSGGMSVSSDDLK